MRTFPGRSFRLSLGEFQSGIQASITMGLRDDWDQSTTQLEVHDQQEPKYYCPKDSIWLGLIKLL
eukprot:scaffold77_cov162-Amphora_coffeaeformis.AAC.3